MRKADRFADLLGAAREGLRVDRRNVKPHHYAAHALSVQGQVSDALVHSREAVRLAPGRDPVMNVQLGWLELNDSEYRHGWARSNCFYTTQAARYLRVFPDAPVWNGEPVAGRTFLLLGEQGLGDQIQFIRFAEWLFVRGAVVDVLVSQPVAELAASMRSVRQAYTQLPAVVYGFSCHMQRMPEHMQFDITMLPIAMPYLGVSQNLVDTWRARLDGLSRKASQQRKRRVGIVWAGGGLPRIENFPDTLAISGNRSSTQWATR